MYKEDIDLILSDIRDWDLALNKSLDRTEGIIVYFKSGEADMYIPIDCFQENEIEARDIARVLYKIKGECL